MCFSVFLWCSAYKRKTDCTVLVATLWICNDSQPNSISETKKKHHFFHKITYRCIFEFERTSKFEICIDSIIEVSTSRFIIGSVSSRIVKDVTCNPWFITVSYCTFYTDVFNPSNRFILWNTLSRKLSTRLSFVYSFSWDIENRFIFISIVKS